MSEQDRSSESVLSLLAGIGLGALLGASAALLMAPRSGAETRSTLREGADDVLTRLRDSVDDLRSKVDEIIASTKQRAGGRPEERTESGSPATDTGPG